MQIVIFHNPKCGTSRNVVRLVQDAGYSPNVIEYLQTGWTKPQLQALFAAADITARDALRQQDLATDLGLNAPDATENQLLDAMIANPILVNRPIVVCKNGAALCRPSGRVLDLLDHWPPAPYYKEDGTMIIDKDNNKVAGV